LAAFLVERFARGRRAFERSADVFRYALITAGSTMISPTLGVTSLAAYGHVPSAEFGAVWVTWWMGDLVSAWVVAPFAIEWWSRSDRLPERRHVTLELVLLASCMAGVMALAFFVQPFEQGGRKNPFTFICLPPLVWAAFRFPRRIVASATLLLVAGAVAGTFQGLGPF